MYMDMYRYLFVITGEGEFLTSEDRIVTVPFQFDLIQLLSQGQQIELFFLMYAKGNTITRCSSSCILMTAHSSRLL